MNPTPDLLMQVKGENMGIVSFVRSIVSFCYYGYMLLLLFFINLLSKLACALSKVQLTFLPGAPVVQLHPLKLHTDS